MIRAYLHLLILGWVLLIGGASAGADPAASNGEIRFPRTPAPSPDGSEIAFVYQGDLWIVPSAGGDARRLTAHPAYDGMPVWSPDGRWIAFASDRDGNRDVYVIPVRGGLVRRLTWYSGNDLPRGWTPDSQHVIFEGRRWIQERGSVGTFMVPLEGGTPVALLPIGAGQGSISPDGRRFAFVRGSVQWWRRGYEGNGRHRMWICEFDDPLGPTMGGRARPAQPPLAAHFGARSAAARGWDEPLCTSEAHYRPGALRPHGRFLNLTALGSVTRLEGGDPQRGYLATYLADTPAWDRPEIEVGRNDWPQWFPDGDHLLYLSEYHGISNLKIVSIEGGSRAFVTRLEEGRMRFPRLAYNGRLAAFEYEDGIYTVAISGELPPPGATAWTVAPTDPARLEIRIPVDEYAQALDRIAVKGGASEMALSPDGEQIAFVKDGEIFAMKTAEDEPFAYRLTDSAARDYQIAWTHDSEGLIFVSDRDGDNDIYMVRSTDEAEKRLARTLHLEIVRLTDTEENEWRPQFSPDGQRIAFTRGNGMLVLMDPDGSHERTLFEGWSYVDFDWSPDSRWLVYSHEDNRFNSDIWIISADGKEGPYNISRHPDDDVGPHWSDDGKMIAFTSNREFLNQTDIWYVRLSLADEHRSREDRLEEFDSGGSPARDQKRDPKEKDEAEEGEEKAPAEVQIDFENIHNRLHRLTTFPGNESRVMIAKDGTGFVFTSDTDGKRDLWWIGWDGEDPKRLTKGGQNPQDLQFDAKGKTIYYRKNGSICSIPIKGGEQTTYPYDGEMAVDRVAQRRFVFDEAWRMLGERFYDPQMHGTNWEAQREKYSAYVDAASTYADFQDVIRLMMGELNSSHLGVWSGPGDWELDGLGAETGQLGVIFDADYRGPGLRIAHIVPNSPADLEESRLAIGETIRAVNGQSVGADICFDLQMDRTVGKKILLDVAAENGALRTVVIRPISPRELRDLYYDEEIALRRAFVAAHTREKVAYIHISGMNTSSLDLFERDLYAEAHGKDALIIDVRGNGGGWTTDLLLTSLMAADHAITIPRDGGPGYPQHRRIFYAWTKPIVVLCNEQSFSNAEIFSWAIRTLHRGPVVGQQTYGGVISTGGVHLADGSYLRLPFRKWVSRLDGSNEEGTGCAPDVSVENLPGDLARGIDLQLARAIEEALRQIER